MIAEIGHFALILAFLLALVQGTVPMIGAARSDPAMMAVARPAALLQPRSGGRRLPRAHPRLRGLGLLGRAGRPAFPYAETADLQDHRRMGEPRGLDGAVGADPRPVRRHDRGLRHQHSCGAPGKGARRARAGSGGLLRLHPVHVQPVPPPFPCAGRRPGSKPAAPGPRPSPSIRRSSISDMSGSRSRFLSPSPR